MLVWRDKIACHGPIARHIPPLSLSLSSPSPSLPADIIDSVRFWLPPRHPFMHTFPAIWQTAWRRGYDRPRWYARCHLGFSCNYELRDERALRGREASKPSDKPQLNYVRGSPCRRKEVYGEGSKGRERKGEKEFHSLGKGTFYDRCFKDKMWRRGWVWMYWM